MTEQQELDKIPNILQDVQKKKILADRFVQARLDSLYWLDSPLADALMQGRQAAGLRVRARGRHGQQGLPRPLHPLPGTRKYV